MPQTLRYSVVAAVQTLWLASRAHGLGLGWVSILDPERLAGDLGVPPPWELVAYCCIGYPEREEDRPELDRAGWQGRFVHDLSRPEGMQAKLMSSARARAFGWAPPGKAAFTASIDAAIAAYRRRKRGPIAQPGARD